MARKQYSMVRFRMENPGLSSEDAACFLLDSIEEAGE